MFRFSMDGRGCGPRGGGRGREFDPERFLHWVERMGGGGARPGRGGGRRMFDGGELRLVDQHPAGEDTRLNKVDVARIGRPDIVGDLDELDRRAAARLQQPRNRREIV